MKKYVFVFALFAMQQLATAQTVNVHFKNGQVVEYPSDNVDYVDFSARPAPPTISAGQVVDLGLSVYWASCNLGAEKPEEIGEFYAWGETKTKNVFSNENYSYYNVNTMQFVDIGNDISGTQYDAATVNLGDDWRMPNKSEMEELIYSCTWEWITLEGKWGYKVTGKNGNSIFIPSEDDRNCIYRTSTSSPYSKIYTYELWATPTEVRLSSAMKGKVGGCLIRPITNNINASGNPIDHSQDYLVTDKISASYTGGSTHSVNGVIQSGSILNFKISNGSSESIDLIGIQLINGNTGAEGNNALSENVTITAGESKAYSITVGTSGISKPKARFTYRYNQKKYYVEVSVPE